MIKEHACVVLTENVLAGGLQAGDVGTVVHIHLTHVRVLETV